MDHAEIGFECKRLFADKFTKKRPNYAAALALRFAFDNFRRPHAMLSAGDKAKGTTSAMKAGITGEVWIIERRIRESSTH